MCVCVCVCVRVRARARVCVFVYEYMCVQARACEFIYGLCKEGLCDGVTMVFFKNQSPFQSLENKGRRIVSPISHQLTET